MNPWEPVRRDPYVDLADDAAHEAALRSRAEARERAERARRTASWLGSLQDLAEQRMVVAVTRAGGSVLRGVLLGLGADHLALRLPDGQLALLASDTVRAVRPEPTARVPAAMGDRPVAVRRRLADVLDRLHEARTPVAILLRDVPDPLLGRVVGMGEDVLTLRPDGAEGAVVLLPFASVAGVLVEE